MPLVFPIGFLKTASSGKRYWRFYTTATVGGVAGVGANTLEFRIAGVAQSVTLATASSEFGGGGFEPALSHDGDNSTRWVSDFSDTWPQWVAHDLGSAKAITSMRLVGNADGAGPSDFKIQSSSNGSDWTDEKTVSGLTGTDWTGVNHIGGSGLGLTFNIP
jgi:hypothetical protein